MSARVRISHNDFPEALEEELRKRFGAAAEIEHRGDGVIEVKIDEHDPPWRTRRNIELVLEDLREGNEWVNEVEFFG